MKNSVKYMMCIFICLLFSFSIFYNLILNNKTYLYSIILSLIVLFASLLFLYLITKILPKMKINRLGFNSKKLFIITFILIFINSLIFLLTYYPGSNMNDTIYIIFAPINYSYQYPLIYSLILSFTYKFYYFIFNSISLGYFFTSITQILFVDFIESYVICWFNRMFKNKISTIILVLYFSFVPIILNYNSALIKDSIFSVLLLLLIPLMYELIITDGKCLNDSKYVIKFSSLIGFSSLIRNNGFISFILLISIMLIKYKKYWKQLMSIFVMFFLISNIVLVLPSKYKKESLFQEKIAIPIQQVSYALITNYESFSSDELEYINKLLDVNTIQNKFDSNDVDAIKWEEKFNRLYLNETKLQFMKIWFNHLTINFKDYVKIYFKFLDDLWTIKKFQPYHSRFLGLTYVEEKYNITEFKSLCGYSILPTNISKKLTNYYNKTTVFFNGGALFWILVLLVIVSTLLNKKLSILFVPYFSIWLTLMIACPIPGALRYMSPIMYALPFLVLIVILKDSEVIEK